MTSKEIKELEVRDSLIFSKVDLKKVRSYIQGKKGYRIVMLPMDKYRLERFE